MGAELPCTQPHFWHWALGAGLSSRALSEAKTMLHMPHQSPLEAPSQENGSHIYTVSPTLLSTLYIVGFPYCLDLDL